mgnify:CR=1 FL=1
MAFITGEQECKICHTITKYYTLVPDCKVGIQPDTKKFVYGDYLKTPGKDEYTISFSCPQCKNMIVIHCNAKTN